MRFGLKASQVHDLRELSSSSLRRQLIRLDVSEVSSSRESEASGPDLGDMIVNGAVALHNHERRVPQKRAQMPFCTHCGVLCVAVQDTSAGVGKLSARMKLEEGCDEVVVWSSARASPSSTKTICSKNDNPKTTFSH